MWKYLNYSKSWESCRTHSDASLTSQGSELMSTVNAGILGHVDAGKTTLTRLLADVSSTAAFDKHAEKHGRHNTIDLGYGILLS